MRWSWPDYLATDADAVEEVEAWMRDIHAENERERREREKKERQDRLRRR